MTARGGAGYIGCHLIVHWNLKYSNKPEVTSGEREGEGAGRDKG